MPRALSMVLEALARPAALPGRLRELVDRVLRLIDPRRWSAAVRVLADLLNGGIVVPPPPIALPGQEKPQREEPPVQIYSVIQPDGDIQTKVERRLLANGDAEAKLAAHMEEVGEALQRIRDATGQALLLRLAFALSSFWAMFDSLRALAAGLAEGAWPSTLLGPLDWALIAGGILLLLASLLFPWLLGWLIRRRLGSLARDLKLFEMQTFGVEADRAQG